MDNITSALHFYTQAAAGYTEGLKSMLTTQQRFYQGIQHFEITLILKAFTI